MLEALDVDQGGAVYLPYAQAILRKLKVVLTLAGVTMGRKELLTPDGEGRISVRTRRGSPGPHAAPFSPDLRIDEWYDNIRISLDSATVQGFLLYKDGVPRYTVQDHRARATFQAYYVDGKVERIAWQAPIGTEGEELEPVVPLPAMETPVRSKGYRMPAELRDEYIDGALQPRLLGYPSASRYSGLMRGVVGNYHARGKNAPFAFWWAKTHGLVKMAPAAADPDTPQYWIVEVTAEGVYAAPVTEGKGNASWNVTRYMPTSAMIDAQPGLQQYRTTLSLAWAYGALPNAGVERLPASVAPAYAGTAFYSGQGWAFNYSGTEAQGISYIWTDDPVEHYRCSRYKLAFSLSGTDADGNGILACALSIEDDSLPATFYNSQVMWVPSLDGIWDYVPQIDAAHQAASLAQYPNQDAPVHVYYAGDTEMVTRWNYTTYGSASDTQNPLLNIPGLEAQSDGRYGYHNYYYANADIVTLYDGDTGTQLTAYTAVPDTWRKQYGTGVTAGFISPGFDTSTEGRSYTLIDETMDHSAPGTVTEGDATDTGGGGTWDYHWVRTEGSTQYRTTRTGTRTNRGSVVVLMQEREGIIGLIDQTMNDSVKTEHEVNNANLVTTYQGNGRNTNHHLNSYSNSNNFGGSSPWGSFSVVNDGTVPDTSFSVDATLMLGEFTHEVDAAGNDQLTPFLISGLLVGENLVTSGAFAMHGNLYAADTTLTPADQKANRIVHLADGPHELFGGFEIPDDIDPINAIAFIGKA